MAHFQLIVCVDRDSGIGLRGSIPWHHPEDLRHFRQVTTSKTIIMGRMTWESLPRRPLPRRENVVVTSRAIPKVITAGSLNDAVALSTYTPVVCGGARLYADAFADPRCNTAWITRLSAAYGCDTRVVIPDDWRPVEVVGTFDGGVMERWVRLAS
jgi:dihydrofolate reductase